MNDEKDKLKSLFQEMKLDKPSAGFESRLMQNIHGITEKQVVKEPFSVKNLLAIIGAIAGILGIPAIILWRMGISLKPDIRPVNMDISFDMPALSIDPVIISIASVCLLLLIADVLIRRRIWEKKHKN